MSTIFKKELKQLFTGMIGCVFIAFVFVLIGIYTTALNLKSGYSNFEYVLQSAQFLFLILIPILTMRSMADETRQRTDQMLFTAPISRSDIIWGKFFAMAATFAIPMLVFCIYPLILSMFGTVNFATAYSSILAFYLLGCALIAVGLFISTLTESQIIAAVVCFVVLFVSYMMSGIVSLISSSALASVAVFTAVALIVALIVRSMTKNTTMAVIVGICLEAGLLVFYFLSPTVLESALSSVLLCFDAFSKLSSFTTGGMFDFSAIIYYVTVTYMFVYLSAQSLEKKRWM